MMLYFILTTFLVGTTVAKVPSYMKICGKRNPNLEACIIDSVDHLRDKLRSGIPELDVPPIEPMIIKRVIVANETSFKVTADDVHLYGFPDFVVTGLKVDLENKRFDIDVSFKRIRLNAEYDVATRVVVPIAGKGPIDIVADDVAAKVILKFQLVDRKGSKYMFFPTMTTKLDIKDYTSHFKSRGGSSGALDEGINAVLSTNRQEIIDTIKPNLEQAVSVEVLQFSNKICKHFTFLELFPDRE